MRKSVFFYSTLFLASLFTLTALADGKGHKGGHKGGGGNKGSSMRSTQRHVEPQAPKKEAAPRAPKGPGHSDKADGHSKGHEAKKPSKEDVHVHVHKNYSCHDNRWYRSRWSFNVGAGGLGFYYGDRDPHLGCHSYYYPRHHYHPRAWVALEMYSYWYEPGVVCPVHDYCHEGHCEWYYNSDGGMVLFWYP